MQLPKGIRPELVSHHLRCASMLFRYRAWPDCDEAGWGKATLKNPFAAEVVEFIGWRILTDLF